MHAPSRLRRPLAALALAAAALASACGREIPVLEADKEVFVRAGDLADFGIVTKQPERFEVFRKELQFDGAYILEYEFQTPESETKQPLFLAVWAQMDRSASGARDTQNGHRIGAVGGLKWEGISMRNVARFPRLGEDASLSLLTLEGRPVGNFFTARKGSRTYSIILSGAYFDDAAEWEALVAPRLARFLEHDPAKGKTKPNAKGE